MIVAQQAPVIGSAVLPLREYLLTGLTATVVTFLLTGPVRVLAVRLGTNWAVPGWATYAVGLLAAMFLQAVMGLVMFTFFILWNRNSVSFLPVRDYRYFVASFGPACGDATTEVNEEPIGAVAWEEPSLAPPARPEVTTRR